MNIRTLLIILYFIIFLFSVQNGKSQGFETEITNTNNPELLEKAFDHYKKMLSSYEKIHINGQRYSGFIDIIHYNGQYLFEIPKTLLGKHLFISDRVEKSNNNALFSIDDLNISPQMVHFGINSNELVLYLSDTEFSSEEKDRINTLHERDKFLNIIAVFEIIGHNKNGNRYVINVDKFFKKEIDLFSPLKNITKKKRTQTQINSKSIKTYSNYLSINTKFNYIINNDHPLIVDINRSLLLLNNKPMLPRIADKRIGYYTTKTPKYKENNSPISAIEYINRWNIQPKKNEFSQYNDDKILQPEKSIFIFIDNAFPQFLKKHIKKGIEDWQLAFEEIGFRNAIVGKYYSSSSDFSINDSRFSYIKFMPNMKETSKTYRWVDPRSGEIIKGNVFINDQIFEIIQKKRFVQTASINKKSRSKDYDNETMGRLIRTCIAHEIGHLLGLKHNSLATRTYDTNSLQSYNFTRTNGITPSIMAGITYNYILQPKNNDVILNFPLIGKYDKFAIAFGYKPIMNVLDPKEELITLNQWIREKNKIEAFQFRTPIYTNNDSHTLFGSALGKDVVNSSKLGIKNLKFTLKNLLNWTENYDKYDYSYTLEMYKEIQFQFYSYLENVSELICGGFIYEGNMLRNKNEWIKFVAMNEQQEAIQFIFNQLKDTRWLFPKELIYVIGSQHLLFMDYQEKLIHKMINISLFESFEFYEGYPSFSYALNQYLDDLFNPIIILLKKKDTTIFENHLLFTALQRLQYILSEQKKRNVSNNENTKIASVITPLLKKKYNDCKAIISENNRKKSNQFFLNYLNDDLFIKY